MFCPPEGLADGDKVGLVEGPTDAYHFFIVSFHLISASFSHLHPSVRLQLCLLVFFFALKLNMILGEVEETVTSTEMDEETDEEIVKKQTRKVGMLFVRGDIVVLVSPPLRTS